MTAMQWVGWIVLALVLALGAGAASGVKIGAEALGKELAALMGAFFGPTAALPAVVVGLVVVHFIR